MILFFVPYSVLKFLQSDDEEDTETPGVLLTSEEMGLTEEERIALRKAKRAQRAQHKIQLQVQKEMEQKQHQQHELQDQVPSGLFNAPMMADVASLAPQPIALKTAVK